MSFPAASFPAALVGAIFGIAVLAGSAPAPAQEVFDLLFEFDPPDVGTSGMIEGTTAGAMSTFKSFAVIKSSGLPQDNGPNGWSLSVEHKGLEILSITTAGTAVDQFFSGGFNKTEVIDPARNDGKTGWVSGVVLALLEKRFIPPNSSQRVAVAEYRATLPDQPGCNPASLEYLDGLRGVGQPVNNRITYLNQSREPTKAKQDLQVCLKEAPAACFNLRVSSSGTDPSQNQLTLPVPSDDQCIAAAGKSVNVTAFIVPGEPFQEKGPQGWSIGVNHDKAVLEIKSVTTAGTAVDQFYSGGFNKTEIINPDDPVNNGRAGFVSGIVLALLEERTLPPSAPSSIASAVYEVVAGQDLTAGISTTVKFENGMKGIGQPVNNIVTHRSKSLQPCSLASLQITVQCQKEEPAGNFKRGDPNNDGKVNIADPIWIINELFRGGPKTLCKDAADANNDGKEDTTDAVFLIQYQFLGGIPPSAPGPINCGPDETPDKDRCPQGSTLCP